MPESTLDVNGDVKIRGIDFLKSKIIYPLYADETGLIGLKPRGDVVTSPVFNAQTDREMLFSASSFNNGNVLEVPLSGDDITINNLGFSASGNYLK